MKRLIFAIFAAFVLMLIPVNAAYGGSVRLIIDDNELSGLSSPPIIVSDSVLVPARAVFEQMGGMVGWHSGNRQITVYHGDDVLVMTIDDRTANLNGAPINMPIPPMIINDSTMIPLRLPAEAFGFGVDWYPPGRVAIINSQYNGHTETQPVVEAPPPTDTIYTAPGSDLPIIDHPQEMPAPPISTEPPMSEPVEAPPEMPIEHPPIEHPPMEHPHEEGEEIKGGNNIPLPGVVVAPPTGINLARDVSTSIIQTVNHPETRITSLRTPRETGAPAYVIVASSPISAVTHFLLDDNRLVVDIHNAVSDINGDLYVDPTVPVSAVRASQFSNEPRVARVVFHLIDAAEFSISLSADRHLLTVSFSSNVINRISANSDVFSDTLFIQGDVLPSVNISTEGFPNFLTINIENATVTPQIENFVAGVFASHFVAGQRPDGTAFIQVHMLNTWPAFSLAQSHNSVALTLHHGITGVRYDSISRELRISRENGFTMDVNQIQRTNEYLRYRYTMILPPSAHVLGQGELSVFDGFINTVNLERDVWGNTQLIFNNARVLEFTIIEMPDEYIIRAQFPTERHPFIVVIDPGHGGGDPGTRHNGVVEKDTVLAISHMVMQLINNNPSIQGYMTRVDDTGVLNLHRAEFANRLGADLFVSVHLNAAEIRRGVVNPAIHGIETWYTIGELEQSQNHRINSQQVSQIFQRNLLQVTGAHDRGLRVGNDLVVLRESNMPSALLELGFITNLEEARRVADTQHQWVLAQAIYTSIVEIASQHHRF